MFKFYGFKAFKNLVKQVVPDKKQDKSDGYVKWETTDWNKNDFPQQLVQLVQKSPAAASAIELWQDFTKGSGLTKDKVIGDTKLSDLHPKFADDIAQLAGMACVFAYDVKDVKSGTVEAAKVFHLPFEEVRLGIPDKNGKVSKIYHNPYFGTSDYAGNKELTRWYYTYDPAGVIDEVKQHNKNFSKDGKVTLPYPGQCFWFGIEKPLARFYPKPFYWSGIYWMDNDSEIQKFHQRNIKNNFVQSVLINMPGDPDMPAGPPADTKDDTDPKQDQRDTVGEVIDKQMKTFQEEKGGAFINWFKKEEEKAEILPFPTSANDTLYTQLQNITSDQLAIATRTPRILISIGTAGKLGDTQEIINAVRIMQGRTEPFREILERIYLDVFKVQTTIINANPVNILTDSVWSSLTLEEQRNYINENFNIELTDASEGVEPQTALSNGR